MSPKNKLIDLAKEIVITEEIIRGLKTTKEKKEYKTPNKRTIIYREKNVGTPRKILEYKTSGKLYELTVVSDSDTTKYMIEIDGVTIVNNTWQELNNVSPFLSDIDAYITNGKYVFRIQNINFYQNITANVYGNTNLEMVTYKITVEEK